MTILPARFRFVTTGSVIQYKEPGADMALLTLSCLYEKRIPIHCNVDAVQKGIGVHVERRVATMVASVYRPM